MSDYYQSYVFMVAPSSKIGEISDKLLTDLIANKIVSAETRHSVMDRDAEGYPPGPNAGLFLEKDIGVWRTLAVNGLEVWRGQSVEVEIGGDLGPMTCPACKSIHDESFDTFKTLMGVLDDWSHGIPTTIACQSCNSESLISDWRTGSGLALGNLVLKFWNWPVFRSELTNHFELVAGMKCKSIKSKL